MCSTLKYLITAQTCELFHSHVEHFWIDTKSQQFNNIKLSFFASHVKRSFPLFTVIRYSRVHNIAAFCNHTFMNRDMYHIQLANKMNSSHRSDSNSLMMSQVSSWVPKITFRCRWTVYPIPTWVLWWRVVQSFLICWPIVKFHIKWHLCKFRFLSFHAWQDPESVLRKPMKHH